ncbi:hypothetical protein FOZ61_010640 [Perkinsus olseni]|uniref:Uncharacterized protein n=1 Tax=Perkinsus olseni TaxID=32597 RepID=A0A7J6KXE4_PEROL|nr:hypothetical protein FOZ61_010640 [Perkinsus olseni]
MVTPREQRHLELEARRRSRNDGRNNPNNEPLGNGRGNPQQPLGPDGQHVTQDGAFHSPLSVPSSEQDQLGPDGLPIPSTDAAQPSRGSNPSGLGRGGGEQQQQQQLGPDGLPIPPANAAQLSHGSTLSGLGRGGGEQQQQLGSDGLPTPPANAAQLSHGSTFSGLGHGGGEQQQQQQLGPDGRGGGEQQQLGPDGLPIPPANAAQLSHGSTLAGLGRGGGEQQQLGPDGLPIPPANAAQLSHGSTFTGLGRGGGEQQQQQLRPDGLPIPVASAAQPPHGQISSGLGHGVGEQQPQQPEADGPSPSSAYARQCANWSSRWGPDYAGRHRQQQLGPSIMAASPNMAQPTQASSSPEPYYGSHEHYQHRDPQRSPQGSPHSLYRPALHEHVDTQRSNYYTFNSQTPQFGLGDYRADVQNPNIGTGTLPGIQRHQQLYAPVGTTQQYDAQLPPTGLGSNRSHSPDYGLPPGPIYPGIRDYSRGLPPNTTFYDGSVYVEREAPPSAPTTTPSLPNPNYGYPQGHYYPQVPQPVQYQDPILGISAQPLLPPGPGLVGQIPVGTNYFVPSQRECITSDYCYACNLPKCKHPIPPKDFNHSQSVAATLKTHYRFKGSEDNRAGTTFISELYRATEGHNDLLRYQWLKLCTDKYVWQQLTDGLVPPGGCLKSYEQQLSVLLQRIRFFFDTDEHIQTTQRKLLTLRQGNYSLHSFIRKIEEFATELFHLRHPVLDYDLKWTLRNGIENAELRHQVDPHLRDDIDYRSFKAIVIQRHQRQTNDPSREDRPRRRDYSPGKTRVSFGTEPLGRQRSRERDYSYPRTRSVSVNSLDESYYSGSEDSGVIANYVAMGKDAVGMRCFRCGGRGHSSRFCTADKPRDYNNRCKICGNTNHKADRCYTKPDRRICHRCNQPGHLAHVCLSNSTKVQTKSTVALRPPTPSARVNSPTNSDSRAVKAEASSEVFMVNYEPSMKGTVSPTTVVNSSSTTLVNELASGILTAEQMLGRSTVSVIAHYPHHADTSTIGQRKLVGPISVESLDTVALFDTGADISLISYSTLLRLCPHKKVDSSNLQGVSTANGQPLQILGTVQLRIATSNASVEETFRVMVDDMAVPVLLGCPALARSRTTLTLTPQGSFITTNIPLKSVKEPISLPLEDLSLEDPIYSHYRVHHVQDLCSESGDNWYDDLAQDEWYNVHYLGLQTNSPYTTKSFCCGQGKHDDSSLGNGPSTTTNAEEPQEDLPPTNSVYTPSGTTAPLSDYNDDGKPPWDVLQREWHRDDSAKLGRITIRVPWLDQCRPPMNYRTASNRGANAVKRLTTDQRKAFEDALDSYVQRGFCAIVQDNSEADYKKQPDFTECQAAWDVLTKGSHQQQGTPELFLLSQLASQLSVDGEPLDPKALPRDQLEKVYYDYKSSPDPEDEDTTPRLGSSDSAKESANMVNGDGINLPDLTGVTTEEVGELTQLLEYAKPNDQIRGGLLEGSLLQECINVCVLRCQTTDPDLSIFGAYLRSEVSAKDLGSRATRLRRLKRICYIDDKGIIRRKDDPYRKVGTTQEDDIGSVLTLGRGVIHLGRTRYSRYFVRILAAIEHYSKGHQACDYGGQGGVAPSPTSTADYGGQEGEVVSVPPSSSDYGDQEGEVAPVPPSSSDYGGQEGEVAPVRPSSSDYSGQGGVAPTTTSEANCVNPGDPHGSQSSTTEHEDPATGEDHQVLPLWKTLRNEEFVRLGSTQGLSCKKFIDGSVTIPAGSVVFAFSKDYTGFAKLLRSAHCPAEALLQP